MPTVVGVILRNTAKPELFDADGLELAADDVVVVTTERGRELGRAHAAARETLAGEVLDDVNRVERAATPEDLAKAEDLHRKEREAIPVYRRLVEKHKLDMKPTDVEFLFDGSRAIFYFVAEERVDFRELVRDLAAEFHMRVDMRQIGVRDEARMIGGLGHCGEQLCCDRFGGEFQPVSIRMAKEQDLPLNPLKISGLCGRLMCCLRYEYDAYKDFKTRAPKKGAIIDIGGTLAKVVDMNTPREMITMRKEDGSRVTFPLADMECCSGQGCPCSVKAEAIDRSMASMGLGIAGAVAGSSSMRERKLTESTMPREAAPPAPSSTPAKAPAPAAGEPSKRRRRRRGGGGGSEGGQPAGDAAAKPARTSRQAGSKQTAQHAPKQAPAGEAGPSAGGKRRRRRRGGGSGGAGEAPASQASPQA
jgi:cell fate regulator YaaT (PSP1 superfamily)